MEKLRIDKISKVQQRKTVIKEKRSSVFAQMLAKEERELERRTVLGASNCNQGFRGTD